MTASGLLNEDDAGLLVRDSPAVDIPPYERGSQFQLQWNAAGASSIDFTIDEPHYRPFPTPSKEIHFVLEIVALRRISAEIFPRAVRVKASRADLVAEGGH
ncbi:hypothetical protein [Novosphingobium resinovorum]|uniref:hypothetical protein n=1 Tax=Novosphingobium resinovorum TaxID=158500 RepID=UPI0012EA6915|nr:hypothetical protein [Novosphingobium resinovorum]